MVPTKQSRLEAFRHHRDHYFGHDDGSPLSEADRAGFGGLRYFRADRPDDGAAARNGRAGDR
jgi:hypothetical protein